MRHVILTTGCRECRECRQMLDMCNRYVIFIFRDIHDTHDIVSTLSRTLNLVGASECYAAFNIKTWQNSPRQKRSTRKQTVLCVMKIGPVDDESAEPRAPASLPAAFFHMGMTRLRCVVTCSGLSCRAA